MRRNSFLGATFALLLAGCGVTPENPAAPSLVTNLAPPAGVMSGKAAEHSADDRGAAHVVPPPAPQLNFADSNQSVSFEASLNAAALRLGAMGASADGQSSQLILVDGIHSASAANAVTRHDNGVVSPPILDQPSVDTERKQVTLAWHRGFVGTPTRWTLNYTLPTGSGGSVDFGGTQTSLTANLPLEGAYTVRVRACDAGGCSDWSQTRTFELRPAGRPGPPASCSATANGTLVTLNWSAPAPNSGGPVVTYVVLYQGFEFPVGLSTSISGTVAPGRYLLGVFARNASGNSAAVTCEVTVGGSTGTYGGSFNGTGAISRSFTDGSCTWQITYSGTVTLALTQGTGGMTGTIRVNGTWSVTEGTQSGFITCLSGSGSYDSTNPVVISGTNIARTGIDMDLATGSFSGTLSATTVTGNLAAAYGYGSGTVTLPVTLIKQ